ncbi:MAG: hypothetical protein AB2552_16375 [Candidatus Thiodiazotropha endolucinida]
MTTFERRQISTAQRYIRWAHDECSSLAETAASHISTTLDSKKKADIEIL